MGVWLNVEILKSAALLALIGAFIKLLLTHNEKHPVVRQEDPLLMQSRATAPTEISRAFALSLLPIGVVVAVSPLVIAYFTTAVGHNMWNESDSSSGANAIWLMVITVPMGALIAIVGVVILLAKLVRSAWKGKSAT